MLQTKVSTKISQFIKFHSSLNVKEHEDGLSTVQYNKIDYPTPCSKGRQKRVGYCRGKCLPFILKNIGTYSTIFSHHLPFYKRTRKALHGNGMYNLNASTHSALVLL